MLALIVWLLASVLLAAPTVAVGAPGNDASECAVGVDFLGFSDALNKQTYEGTNVGGLSALTYDRSRGVYYSLVDNEDSTAARYYTLRIPLDGGTLGEPTILDVTTLRDASGQPYTGENYDGEGIALTHTRQLLISSETEPSIRRFSLDGRLLEELPVPRRFVVAPAGEATTNRSLESLALSPNNRSLFTAVEAPLAPDGQTADGGNRIRILRYEDCGPGGLEPVEQFFYLTEAGQSVVEIVALSETQLLVLERGFTPGVGNTVRVFQVSLRGAPDISNAESLATAGVAPVEKTLLLDVAACPPSGATTPGTQSNPLLDNYESLALGPRLPGGQRSLLLQSDDNFSAGQVTRIIALGVENARLQPWAESLRQRGENIHE